jgi:endonuclease-3
VPDKFDLDTLLQRLRDDYDKWEAPPKKTSYGYVRTPFTVTVSVILSFRTKDEVTQEAGERLFAHAHTPEAMLALGEERIRDLIYPVGFYRKKARTVISVSREISERFDGKVPDTQAQLLSIKGIGPKAAAIILERAFGKNVVAVDTHVHRLMNMWGVIRTATPEESYEALQNILDEEQKKGLNRLLVAFGQAICRPKKPDCERCPVIDLCNAASTRP